LQTIWTPVFTGVTTFYDAIILILFANIKFYVIYSGLVPKALVESSSTLNLELLNC